MDICDEELIQSLTKIGRSARLQGALEKCGFHDSSKTAPSALRDMFQLVKSQYKKEEKAPHKRKSWKPCGYCGHQHEGGSWPATNPTCRSCGKKDHWAGTTKCPARNTRYRTCNLQGNYSKCCPGKQHQQPEFKSGISVPLSASYTRNITNARLKLKASPKVCVSIQHDGSSGSLVIIPTQVQTRLSLSYSISPVLDCLKETWDC